MLAESGLFIVNKRECASEELTLDNSLFYSFNLSYRQRSLKKEGKVPHEQSIACHNVWEGAAEAAAAVC